MSLVFNNKKILIFLFTLLSFSFAKERYITREGLISFFSSTPLEDIKAVNKQVSCVLDKSTGEFAFQLPIKGFTFKNALMQEHFNESYLESDIYPKSVFKGKILDWNNIQLSESPKEVFIEGELTIHGIKQKIKESGKIWRSSKSIIGKSNFNVELVDYNIKVPKVVRSNIAEVINVSISVQLNPK
tara:strand:+ start:236 stop:793 length:558 start_codon:yes stop_codon:yes gene_type:complete